MLNIDKIWSLVNSKNLSNQAIGDIIGVSEATIRHRRKENKWMAFEIENLATYFNKSIAYFFDKENDAMQASEPSAEYRRKCLQCEEKDKKIIDLQEKLLAMYEHERSADQNGVHHDAAAS